MNKETVQCLQAKGKWHPKEELAFYSKASLEQIERAEANLKSHEFARLDRLDAEGKIDPYNPPNMWAITFQRWLVYKYGVKWVFEYLAKVP